MLSRFISPFLIIFAILNAGAVSYSYDHLPLSPQLQKSFPKIHSTCFIIVETISNTILHEKNSTYKIYINDNQPKESMYDIVCSRKDFSATSSISGRTFVFEYTNKHKCKFKIALSGLNTLDQFQEDKAQLIHWLDQYFIVKACSKNETLAKIPVIYSDDISEIIMKPNRDIFILLSDKQPNNRIVRNITYRSVIAAPCALDTMLGSINVLTTTFSKPISKKIYSPFAIKRNLSLKTFQDSIKYLIFGTSLLSNNSQNQIMPVWTFSDKRVIQSE